MCKIQVKNVFNKQNDGKEHNTTKGVSIATEFDKFKMLYLIKRILDIKWKEFKVKT